MEKSLGTWMEAEHPREGDIYCLEIFVDRCGRENCPSWYQNSQYQLLHFCPKCVGFCMPIKTKTRKISWQNTLIWSLSTGFWFHSTSKFLKLWRIERRENICLKTGLKDWEKWACFQLSLQVSFLMVPSGTRTWHEAQKFTPQHMVRLLQSLYPSRKLLAKGFLPSDQACRKPDRMWKLHYPLSFQPRCNIKLDSRGPKAFHTWKRNQFLIFRT